MDSLNIDTTKQNNGEGLETSSDQSSQLYNGYTDSELESLAEPAEIEMGIAPWIYWSSEHHSFGRLYRQWGFYPRLFPLFFYSDHGIHRVLEFTPHEISNDAAVHFVFNMERATRNSDFPNKKVICVPHPWISYRRKNNIRQSESAKGTLVFFSHATEGVEFHGRDSDEYFETLKSLPEKYHPLVICMHMHDIKNGHHKKLRKHGLPIVTAGNTSSIGFVDRYYNLIRNFKYACSNETGSQLYYCVEMGIPYFFIGDRIYGVNRSHPDLPLGLVNSDLTEKEFREVENNLFGASVDVVNLQQKVFVEWALGLNSSVTRLQASWIMWQELFRNWKRWSTMFRPTVAWILRKIGLMKTMKRFIKK